MSDDPVERLHALRVDVERRLGSLRDDENALLRDRADATADDEHDPEGSTLSGEWSRVDALRRGAQAEREDILEALARVELGTYGVCISCGRPIAPGRLEARPTAARCVACAV